MDDEIFQAELKSQPFKKDDNLLSTKSITVGISLHDVTFMNDCMRFSGPHTGSFYHGARYFERLN
jgi:hypothetical protein